MNSEISEISTVINYTLIQADYSGLRANFYLSKNDYFYGMLVCNCLNQSRQATSKRIASASLSLLYMPYKQDVNNIILVCCALSILLVTLLIHSIIAFAMVRFFKRRHTCCITQDGPSERHQDAVNGLVRPRQVILDDGKCVTEKKKKKLLKSPSSISCQSQEEATNVLLKCLAHPTSGTEDKCPCDVYKAALEDYRTNSADAISKTTASSNHEIETDFCVDLQKNGKPVLRTSTLSHLTPFHCKREVMCPKICDNSFGTPTSIRENQTNHVSHPDTFVVDMRGGSYSNEDHQVYLRVPEGAVPEGKSVCINIGISLTSSKLSLLPLKSQIVSPVASFHVEEEESDFEFLKPVEITLPHFVDIEDEDDATTMELAFLKSSCHLYCFHRSKGVATFRPKSHTATLRTTHFCSFCIAANKKIPTEKINYRLVKVVPRMDHQREQWRAHFCVTYYLRTCLEVTKKMYIVFF